VRHHGRATGRAVPHQIGRHVHPKAATDPAPAPTPTGIDYLRLVEDRHTRSLGERLHYAQLAEPAQQAESPVASPAADTGADTGVEDPPPDRDGLTYSADLLTLAGIGPADPPPPPSAPSAAPDSAAPDLEETR
jgi:hypothetical protein